MTRKDYELIAWTIRATMIGLVARAEAAHAFASTLRATNSRFDRERFLAACISPWEEWVHSDIVEKI